MAVSTGQVSINFCWETARIPEAQKRFAAGTIALKGIHSLARDYERSVALSVGYSLTALPNEERLRDDLREMVRLYSILTARGGRDNLEDTSQSETTDGDDDSIVERRRYRRHRKIERASGGGKRVKKIHGYVCQCCRFDFSAVYGPVGANYIEAHHLTPLSELPEDVPVSQDPKTDFAVLCANCHRIIHRKDSPKSVAELRSLPGVKHFTAMLEALALELANTT